MEHLFWKIPLGAKLEEATPATLVDSGDALNSLHINVKDDSGTRGDKRDHQLRLILEPVSEVKSN